MGIQYVNRGGCQLRLHPPLKILDAYHYDTIDDGRNKKSHLLFANENSLYQKHAL